VSLQLKPISLKEANALIQQWHRHHKPVPGQKFAIGVMQKEQYVGAAVTGRPVARMTDHKTVAEVTRCVTNGTKNACSILYAACARAAEAMGYEVIQTFILANETGTSLRAAGWEFAGTSGGGDWNRPSRGGRRTDQPQVPEKEVHQEATQWLTSSRSSLSSALPCCVSWWRTGGTMVTRDVPGLGALSLGYDVGAEK
jgi:hypothetical protein